MKAAEERNSCCYLSLYIQHILPNIREGFLLRCPLLLFSPPPSLPPSSYSPGTTLGAVEVRRRKEGGGPSPPSLFAPPHTCLHLFVLSPPSSPDCMRRTLLSAFPPSTPFLLCNIVRSLQPPLLVSLKAKGTKAAKAIKNSAQRSSFSRDLLRDLLWPFCVMWPLVVAGTYAHS